MGKDSLSCYRNESVATNALLSYDDGWWMEFREVERHKAENTAKLGQMILDLDVSRGEKKLMDHPKHKAFVTIHICQWLVKV